MKPSGRGSGDSMQKVREVTKRRLCLWACFVRQEKTELSALNQTCDKSDSDVWDACGHCLMLLPLC